MAGDERMNQRRLLVLAFGAGIAGHTALLRAQTSSNSLRRVGVITSATRPKTIVIQKPFYDQMRQLGWVEGKNIAYDWVEADDQLARLPRLADELVARAPEVIYAATGVSAMAARDATKTIPIVFAAVADPVALGLVASLGRPGGNATGIASIGSSLAPKRVELLREILPGVKRLGLLGDPNDPTTTLDQAALAPVAASLGLTLMVARASNAAEFDAAIAMLIADRADAIISGGSNIAYFYHPRLIELAHRSRVPVIAYRPVVAEAGALFAYGASLADQFRRSALVVDKILKGTKPADIPVEQATLFELVVNLRTANALGITIPRSILLRADRVIE